MPEDLSGRPGEADGTAERACCGRDAFPWGVAVYSGMDEVGPRSKVRLAGIFGHEAGGGRLGRGLSPRGRGFQHRSVHRVRDPASPWVVAPAVLPDETISNALCQLSERTGAVPVP